MLSKQELASMHEAVLHILEKTGIYFETERAQSLFKQHGFQVDGKWVYMTRAQVEEYLELMPKVQYAPVTQRVVQAANPFLNSPTIYDEELKRNRRPYLSDVVKTHKLAETSDLYVYANPGLIDPVDLSMEDNYLAQLALTLKYSKKPLNLGIRASITSVKDGDCYASAKNGIELVRRFSGISEGLALYAGFCPMSPLGYDEECLANLDAMAEERQGIILFPCSLSYMTGPETIMGMVVHDLALAIAGVIYVQLLAPGLDVALSEFSTMTDLRTMQPCYGSPEYAHTQVMYYEFCKYLQIGGSVCGSLGDSAKVGYQAGAECMLSTLLPFTLTQLGEIWCYPGAMAAFSGANFKKMILDEECMRLLNKSLNKKYSLDEDLMDALEQVKTEGSFLSLGHPANYRADHYLSEIFSKESLAVSETSGRDAVDEQVCKALEARLNSYVQPELSAEQKKLLAPYLPPEER